MLRASSSSLLLMLACGSSSTAGASCTFTAVGCYQDGGGTNGGSTDPPCSDCSAEKRILRYNLKNCPEDKWYPPLPGGTPPSPVCDPAKVSTNYCAQTCAAWLGWSSFYIGLQSGVGVPHAVPNYAECTCDIRLPTPMPASLGQDKCPARCPGSSSSNHDRCGGAPGAWTSSVYKVECGTTWGVYFLGALVVVISCYAAVGIWVAPRRQPTASQISSRRRTASLWERHPHYPRWVAGWALVQDGVAFARAGGGRTAPRTRAAIQGSGGVEGNVGSHTKLLSDAHSSKGAHKKERKRRSEHKKGGSKVAKGLTGTGTPASNSTASDSNGGLKSAPSGSGGRWVHIH